MTEKGIEMMNIAKNMIRIIYTYSAAIWVELGAIALLIIGNNSRPYAAFGGEEMGFIALSVWAIVLIKKKLTAKQRTSR